MKRIATVFALASVAVALIVISGLRNEFFDSKVYHGAIQYWFRDGGLVYDWLKPGTPYGFTYPPFAGLVMLPMAWLPMPAVVVFATVGTMVTVTLLVHWLAGPYFRSRGWTGWFPLAVAVCFALAFEPVRETITFGQVNTLLLAVVAFDMLFGVGKGRKWAGVGIGLATAVKLTPGVFLLYLVVTRRWRALFTSIGTATAVTLLAGAIFPDESRVFWTSALWDTNRVGVLSFLSNQSLRGALARGPFDTIESTVWLVCALAVLALWAWRVARFRDDVAGGLALTGVLGCLLSPVTWIHHCVWLIPALILCLTLYGSDRPRFWLGASAYLLMTSHVTWLWETGPRPPLAIIGSNVYVLFSLALLVWTPLRTRSSSDVHEADKITT